MAVVTGSSGSDTLLGTASSDVIDGLGGADSIYAGQGDDIVDGGRGNDYIEDGDTGSSDFAPDNDVLRGGDDDDTIVSYQGLHFLDRDTLYGGDGNDNLISFGSQTNDSLDGGNGIDVADVRMDATTFQSVFAVFNLAGFVIQLNGVNTVFVSNCEAVVLSSGEGNDTLMGGALDDFLISYGGLDTMDGKGGNDRIAIRLEDATFTLETVNLTGGAGTDTLEWSAQTGLSEAMNFDLSAGQFRRNGVSMGTITGFERLEVYGGNGNDSFTGGTLGDVLSGQGGNDLLTGGQGDDVLQGGAGSDTLYGGSGRDALNAESFGLAASNVLYGGADNDTLTGGSLVDTLDGGSGNDLYLWGVGDVLVDAGGIDTIRTSTSTIDLNAFAFIENVEITGGFLANVTGNALDNTVTSFGISGTYSLGLGNDRFFGGRANETVSGGDGDDTMSAGQFFDSLSGGNGNDSLSGDEGRDTVNGDTGNDTVQGGEGNDLVLGGDGSDRIFGDAPVLNTGLGLGSGVQTKAAGQGTTADTAVDLTNNFALFEDPDIGDSTDVLHTTVNATHNEGGDWYEVTIAAAGLMIQADIDRADIPGLFDTEIRLYDPNGTEVVASFPFFTVNLGGTGSVTDTDGYVSWTAKVAGTYRILVIDDTFFDRTSDLYTLHVSVGNPGGDDSLEGGAGDDEVLGGFRNDTLDGGAGTDTLDGGKGIDWASYASATTGVTVSLALTTAQATGGGGTDTLLRIENLIGTAFNDTLTGNGQDNSFDGGLGNDRIDGGAGFDSVSFSRATGAVTVDLSVTTGQNTGAGTDRLIGIEAVTGSAFGDNLVGTTGDDALTGGDGDDSLSGGGGGNDTISGGAGIDLLSYAGLGTGLRLDLALTGEQVIGGGRTGTVTGIEHVTGSGQSDRILGDGAANTFDGGVGNDTLDGRDGDDTLVGGAGNDTLTGGLGIDLADYAGTAAVTVDLAVSAAQNTGGAGTDRLSGIEAVAGGTGDDTLSGDGGANTLDGRAGNDSLAGRSGADTLVGGTGSDTIDGGTGFDTASYATATAGVTVSLAIVAAQATGGAGTDRLTGIEALVGSDFADDLTGNAAGNALDGGAGNDTLTGGDGDDTLTGGGGDDRLTGGIGSDTADYSAATLGVTVDLALATAQTTGGAGSDRLSQIENLTGSAFGDRLSGSALGNTLNGGAGSDTILGQDGDDLIFSGVDGVFDSVDGGLGNDTLSYASLTGGVFVDLAQTAFSQFTGAAGTELITGFENLIGTAFFDTLRGDTGDNRLDGGQGDDTLEGRDGNDTLNGGEGSDLANYGAATASVTVDLAITAAQDTGGAGTDRLSSIERLLGSNFDDTLLGAGSDNVLDGGIGNDSLAGRGGNDTFQGGSGNDLMDGGTGRDRVLFNNLAAITIDLNVTTAQNTGGAGTDTFLGIEDIIVFSNSAADTLIGNGAGNYLDAYGGNDTLMGMGGDDTIVGSFGINTLDGGDGFDIVTYLAIPGVTTGGVTRGVTISLAITGPQIVYGGSTDSLSGFEGIEGSENADTLTGDGVGNLLLGRGGADALDGAAGGDTLAGGLGNDTLTGGDGSDRFLFDTAPDDAANVDTIIAFAAGLDEIALDATIFAALGPTVAAAELVIGPAATTSAHRLVYDAATGLLTYDADGAGGAAATAFAQLSAGLALSAGDFVIV